MRRVASWLLVPARAEPVITPSVGIAGGPACAFDVPRRGRARLRPCSTIDLGRIPQPRAPPRSRSRPGCVARRPPGTRRARARAASQSECRAPPARRATCARTARCSDVSPAQGDVEGAALAASGVARAPRGRWPGPHWLHRAEVTRGLTVSEDARGLAGSRSEPRSSFGITAAYGTLRDPGVDRTR